jgi:acetylornithine/succinyldiaminopimelate/putrescine aminotransferase
MDEVPGKEQLIRDHLLSASVREIRSKGLLIAVQLENREQVKKIIAKAMEEGIILDWFLFCDSALRISPPLIITREQLNEVCRKLRGILDSVTV